MPSLSILKGQVIAVSKAINTDWFDTDIVPTALTAIVSSGGIPVGAPVFRHTLMISVPTTTIVSVHYVIDGKTVIMTLNTGIALTGGAAYIFDILVPRGTTGYNIQHATTIQLVTAVVTEMPFSTGS